MGDAAKSDTIIVTTCELIDARVWFVEVIKFRFDFSEKRKAEELPKEQSSSPKRKRLTPSPGPPSSGSSVSGGDSDTEKHQPLSAFYQSLLESSLAADGEFIDPL